MPVVVWTVARRFETACQEAKAELLTRPELSVVYSHRAKVK